MKLSNITYPILHIKQYSYTIFTRNAVEHTLIKGFCIQVCSIHYISRKRITYYASILPYIHHTHCIHHISSEDLCNNWKCDSAGRNQEASDKWMGVLCKVFQNRLCTQNYSKQEWCFISPLVFDFLNMPLLVFITPNWMAGSHDFLSIICLKLKHLKH